MTARGEVKQKKISSQSEHSEREPYVAPRIVYREPLEAVATTCQPAPPSKGSVAVCSDGPLSS